MTNERMLRIILQEIADVRLELKQDIALLDSRLSSRLDSLETRLSSLHADVQATQRTLVHCMRRTDKRLDTMEASGR